MGRTKGSKNKSQNTNTAKNKNIININVNSGTKKKGRGRPRRTNDTSPNRNFSGGGIGNAPQQVIVSQPQPDNNNNSNNSLLSSFITSKLLNDTMSLNRTNIEQTAPIREQQTFFNARESIIPRFPDTPVKNVINEVKPLESTGPPAPPAPPKPPPIPPKTAAQNTEPKATLADVLKELEYNQSEEGKAEKARKKAADWHASPEGREWHRRHAEKMQLWKINKREPRNCLQCNKEFDCIIRKNGYQQKFCHPNCKSAYYRKCKKLKLHC